MSINTGQIFLQTPKCNIQGFDIHTILREVGPIFKILYYHQTYRLLGRKSGSYPQFMVRARKRNEAIARIDNVSPRTDELFYLRALLLHQPAYSFED